MNPKKTGYTMLTVSLTAALLISACSNDGGSGTGEKPESSPGSDKKQPASPAVANLNETGFPIVNEPIQLTFFTGKDATNSNNFEETFVWKKYREKTNVNVKFQLVPFDSLTERRNLALASGDYPDAFYTARLTAADLTRYGAQGVIIPLNDLIAKYAPNFQKMLDKQPGLREGLTMPDGKIYSFPSYYSPDFYSILIGTPIWIKEEWLQKLGMKEPQTIDQFYEYLKAVQKTDLNGNGKQDEVPFSGANINILKYHLQGAWGLGTRGISNVFVDVDPATDKLRFFRTDPKYKEVLEFMHKLYKEGLIDPEILTTNESAFRAKGSKGNFGSAIATNPISAFGLEGYIGLGALEGPHGDKLYSHVKSPLVHVGAFAITNKNKHPEATVRWMDYFFSDEGAKFYFMGEEGVTYTKQPDGTLEYVEDITNNKDGLTSSQARAKYFTWNGGSYPGHVQSSYFKDQPNAIAHGEKVKPYGPKEVWNPFPFTDAENDFRSTVGNDIHTYITEMEAKFIVGDEPFSKWDDYAKTNMSFKAQLQHENEQRAFIAGYAIPYF
ncbi:putative aldouronate transport system substrate-binding protein [Paenibacillus sp. UNCCL117]|uniref:extracellular solute-binding protein n=1 Tax=unclassified Paenibacillus TaxID=185978 RepID=UPI000882AF76|nr:MULTISPECIES: extracellular solute-binding protein [unclassified Paenibacillus]SDE68505.1 putative aldouronate transport system substrate-binding protein [Paenibacillus sp. cl123]SFW70845.1 putative aldouronate transport system substrate-binding protein [Paenibacillus sp. UNCCL117]